MCYHSSMVEKTVVVIRIIEPVFWIAQGLIMLNLFFPKKAFEAQLRWLNNLLHYQGFDVQIKRTEKAYKIWHRDLWILFFLNPWIVVLIHLI